MKLTIESTSDIVTLKGIEARVWNGVTEKGTPCKLFIPFIGVHVLDTAEFDSVLLSRDEQPEVPALNAYMQTSQLDAEVPS